MTNLQHALCVTADIAHHGIDLCHADFHSPLPCSVHLSCSSGERRVPYFAALWPTVATNRKRDLSRPDSHPRSTSGRSRSVSTLQHQSGQCPQSFAKRGLPNRLTTTDQFWPPAHTDSVRLRLPSPLGCQRIGPVTRCVPCRFSTVTSGIGDQTRITSSPDGDARTAEIVWPKCPEQSINALEAMACGHSNTVALLLSAAPRANCIAASSWRAAESERADDNWSR